MFVLNPLNIYSRSDLLASVPISVVRRAIARGDLLRLRRDVYVSPAMPPRMQEALAVGGSLCCVSALAERGAWHPPARGLHLTVPHNASRLSRPRSEVHPVTVHWSMDEVARPLTTVDDAIMRLLTCQPRPISIAVLDSALSAGIVSDERVREANARVPAVFRLSPSELDPRAESGIESLVRVAIRDAGLRVASQVVIPGVGRVDLLVEGRVIVEVDGREWHRGEQERDYRRDLEALQRGYRVVRVDYEHAVAHEQLVVAAVERSASAVVGTEDGVTFLRSSGTPRAYWRGIVGGQALYS